MRHTYRTADTDAEDQHKILLDQLVGDPSAVDDYYTARQHSSGGHTSSSAGTQMPVRAWA
jgi:hypothetical protein